MHIKKTRSRFYARSFYIYQPDKMAIRKYNKEHDTTFLACSSNICTDRQNVTEVCA